MNFMPIHNHGGTINEDFQKDIPDIFIDKKKSSFPENIIKKVFKGVLTAQIENKEIEGYKIKKTFSFGSSKFFNNSTKNDLACLYPASP